MSYDDFAGYCSDTKEYEWEDKNYKIRLISDLETSHIRAIVKRFHEHHDPKLFWQQDWKYDYLVKELAKRQEKLLEGKGTF